MERTLGDCVGEVCSQGALGESSKNTVAEAGKVKRAVKLGVVQSLHLGD